MRTVAGDVATCATPARPSHMSRSKETKIDLGLRVSVCLCYLSTINAPCGLNRVNSVIRCSTRRKRPRCRRHADRACRPRSFFNSAKALAPTRRKKSIILKQQALSLLISHKTARKPK